MDVTFGIAMAAIGIVFIIAGIVTSRKKDKENATMTKSERMVDYYKNYDERMRVFHDQ